MSIIIDEKTRVVVQGISGGQGRFHANTMREYGTMIVAGVTPGKGGANIDGIPVYDSIREVQDAGGRVNASIIFVPAPFAKDAALEAVDAGLDPVVIITEHIPVHDSIEVMDMAKIASASSNRTGSGNESTKKIHIVGPNTPGIISPEKCKMGVMPSHVFSKGNVGLISRSGTLTYEIVDGLTRAGLGQSTAIGLGGDPVVGLSFIDLLEEFETDRDTKAVVLIGEIGGNAEELAANHIKEHIEKPVVAYVAGRTAPAGKRMGHAGAIISGSAGTADSKINAFKNAGVRIAATPSGIPKIVRELI